MSIEDVMRNARHHIDRVGQSLIGVPGANFTYTIGNYEKYLPELLILGINPNDAGLVLNMLGQRQRDNDEPLLGDHKLSEGSPFPVRLRSVENLQLVQKEYTCQVQNFYRTTDYKVTQVLVPDKHGRFPGDPSCEKPFSLVRIL